MGASPPGSMKQSNISLSSYIATLHCRESSSKSEKRAVISSEENNAENIKNEIQRATLYKTASSIKYASGNAHYVSTC